MANNNSGSNSTESPSNSLATGNTSAGKSSPSAQYLYVSSNSISGFEINNDGTLTPIPGQPALTPGQLSTAKNMLLVDKSQNSSAQISLYNIAAESGNLTLVSSMAAGGGFATLDPSGSSVYANGGTTGNPGTVSAFAIAGSSLSSIAGSPYQYSIGEGSNPVFAQLVQVDPSGKLLYMPLSPQDEHTPSGFFGIATRNSDGSLSGFATAEAGCISVGSQAVIPGKNTSLVYSSCIDDWSGRYWISCISVDNATGAPMSCNAGGYTSPSPTQLLLGLAADPTGQWLAATDVNNKVVHIMAVDRGSGALTDAADHMFPTGTGHSAVAFDHTARFLYVINGGFTGSGLAGSNNINAYAFDAATGMLTQLAGSPYPTGPSPTSVVIAQPQ